MGTVTTWFIHPACLFRKLRLLFGRSRMNGDVHVRFWIRGVKLVTVLRLKHYRILELKKAPRVWLFACDVFLLVFVLNHRVNKGPCICFSKIHGQLVYTCGLNSVSKKLKKAIPIALRLVINGLKLGIKVRRLAK